MRSEIPAWVAVVVIVVIVLIAAVLVWRGTGVQKQEFLPGEKMKELGVKMKPPQFGQPQPGAPAPSKPSPSGQ